MTTLCTRCRRASPPSACYCYFDGTLLPGREGHAPIAPGSQPFPRPFVFPSGYSCANFNQLALGMQQNWIEARNLLMQGKLEPFLEGLGRFDLSEFARGVRSTGDGDRALDDLLGKIPSETLQGPKLVVEPSRLNLGALKPGQDQRLDILVGNHGMRLLWGTIATDCDWLAIGESAKERIFQTPTETHVPVHVVGTKLRAGAKPLEGILYLETNAGSQQVVIRAEVPIRPFPNGALAGATTPRELAVKAKNYPREAGPLFEMGDVRDWYESNGWTYPVEGPDSTGVGAVQQFFEALGLTRPPRVEISDKAFHLKGSPGEKLEHRIKVTTVENRHVFAHASCGQSWVRFGPSEGHGRVVRVPITIDVPNRPGEKLLAHVAVRSNGNQRFSVPIELEVAGRLQPVKEKSTEVMDKPTQTEAGLGGLVYWSGILGGWSAFLGWLTAEGAFGSKVGDSFLWAVLMVVVVAAFLGTGIGVTQALVLGQWRRIGRALGIGLAGGLLGGLIGGLLGNGLFLLIGQSYQTIAFLGRVLGWVLVGAFIGASEGLLRRNLRKLRNGLLGGMLGGLIGGLAFNPVSQFIGSPISSRAFAFVILGLSIGFFLGLIRVLLKDAWLTVEEGFRPGRQLILDQPETTMGTSEKAGLIFIAYGAKGVEPVHLRIRRQADGRFAVEDNASRTGTMLNGERIETPQVLRNDDLIQLGINKVRFRERFRAK